MQLEQQNIDRAFSRPMRGTKQIAQNDKYKVYLLNGKNVGKLGVENFNYKGIIIQATSIERTLIDMTVRPDYSGGPEKILDAFKRAKGKLVVSNLITILKQMNFTYPYHQSIGLYMEKAKYPESDIKLIEEMGIVCKFYLSYQIKDYDFSEKWKIIYPKGL